MNDKKITSLEDLKRMAEGDIVELPSTVDGVPFIVRLRRPSMLALAAANKIPNSLLSTATTLFEGKKNTKEKADDDALSQMYGVCKVMAEAAFVEPTWAQLQEVGYELTDEQLLAVFNYTQAGVKALESFRKK